MSNRLQLMPTVEDFLTRTIYEQLLLTLTTHHRTED